jgi:hypothetical protein
MYPGTASGQLARTTPITAGRLAKFGWTLQGCRVHGWMANSRATCPLNVQLDKYPWTAALGRAPDSRMRVVSGRPAEAPESLQDPGATPSATNPTIFTLALTGLGNSLTTLRPGAPRCDRTGLYPYQVPPDCRNRSSTGRASTQPHGDPSDTSDKGSATSVQPSMSSRNDRRN